MAQRSYLERDHRNPADLALSAAASLIGPVDCSFCAVVLFGPPPSLDRCGKLLTSKHLIKAE